MSFATRFGALRSAHDMTLEEVGRRLDPPKSAQAVWKWENEGVIPRSKALFQLADLFNVSVSDLLGDGDHVDPVASSALVPVLATAHMGHFEASTYSVATGESVESMVVAVRWTRTARGGHVDALKNGQSARVVPVVVPGRELLSASLRSLRESALAGCRDDAERAAAALSWAHRPIVDMPYPAFDYRWGKALGDMGLRFIPPKVLRHTSTTIMETAGVSHDLADKMHGRSDHGVAYRNYYRPDAALMEDAAGRVAAVLTLPPRPSPVDGMPGNDVPAGGEG